MKKFIKICTILMALTVILSASSLIVLASNVDTAFSYNLNGGDNFKTEARYKENSTSVYMNCQTSTGSYVAGVYGGDSEACSYDCSNGYYYYFNQGYARFMYNKVYEWGYEMAAVYAVTTNNGTVASGLWSPDSVPQSGVLPASDYIQ